MEENTRTAEGLRFGCPGCGSGLRYDIKSKRMLCGSCGQGYDLREIRDPSRGQADGMMDTVEYRCPQCGATVHASETSAASFCSYCGADVILAQRLTRIARPAQIVPFRVTREACEEIYRKRVKESRYAPEDFASQETIGHFRPVYIPFWSYRGTAQGDDLSGTATHVHVSHGYEYTDRYQYTLAGDVSVTNVIYDASVSFEDETARRLHFSAKGAVDFHPGYLCGFYAETPDTEPSLFEDGVRGYAQNAWAEEFKKQCGYSAPQAAPLSSLHADADLLLMPVWLLAHRSGSRVVYTAVNGDTGEIVCETPVSNRRFVRLAGELAALCAALLMLLNFVIILRPRLLAALCGLTATVGQCIIARVLWGLRIRSLRENDYTWLQLHPNPRTGKIRKAVTRNFHKVRWYMPLLITGGAVAVGMVLANAAAYDYNAFVAGLLSDHGWLAPVIQGCATALFIASGYHFQKGLDDALFVARLAAMLVTLLAIFGAAADMVFYLCSAALLALTALSLARLNQAHNAFVSRPVPFFGEEAQQQ